MFRTKKILEILEKKLKLKIYPKDSYLPGELEQDILYVREDSLWIIFLCPCGCKKEISLSEQDIFMYLINKKNELTFSPDIKVIEGCNSHFAIKENKVIWIRGYETCRDWRPRICIDDSKKNTHKGNIKLHRQKDVEKIKKKLKGKTYIDGNLIIGNLHDHNFSDIKDLTALEQITDVSGNVIISNVHEIVSLKSLSNLKFIGKSLEIIENEKLKDITSFKSLRYVDGDIQISRNRVLSNIKFDIIQIIGNSLTVDCNYNLMSLGDFPFLEVVDHFIVSFNESLSDIGNFPVLRKIYGGFFIHKNPKLSKIDGSKFKFRYPPHITKKYEHLNEINLQM